MAKQELIPGWGAINETALRQFFVPGWGLVNETVTNTFNETHTATVSGGFLVEFGSVTFDDLAFTLTLAQALTASNTAQVGIDYGLASAFDLNPLSILCQEFIPGGYALNETATRQYFIPGQGAVNEIGHSRTVHLVSASFIVQTQDDLTLTYDTLAAYSVNAEIIYSARLSDLPPGTPEATFGPSSGYGEAIYGESMYADLGTGDQSGANPTYTYPYVYVEYAAGLAEGLTAGDSLQMSRLMDIGMSFEATASFAVVGKMTIDELLLGGRLTKVAARRRTVIVRKQT